MTRLRTSVIATIVLAVLSTATATATGTAAAGPPGHAWFTSWAQSQERLAATPLRNQSIRMLAHLSQGGTAVRFRLQNTFGRQPLTLDRATVAISTGGATTGTPKRVTFHGRRSVTIPAGGETWSDATVLATRPGDDVAISVFAAGEVLPGQHNSAFRDNYLTPPGAGDHTADTTGEAYSLTTGSTLVVSAVDVHNPALKGTVVPFGSSVVDGVGSTNCGPGCTEIGTHKRWTDFLARRIVAELPRTSQLAVANAGISGTTSAVCPRSPEGVAGLDAMARLERDVLSLHGVKSVIYYYGTNDLANGCTANEIITSYRTVFGRLRDAGIDVHVTPITPRPGYTDQNNIDRHVVAGFVRNGGDCTGTCTGVTDFDQVLADPVKPNSILPAYDTGDGVHVNIAGQEALANFVALRDLV
ncbi:SGNH hydrolase [Lentzea guizhouensis]|uniref:SGNH hydrolase n=1 Tax=Lentzea guizhouensis TaxID=1586287 RepID=A0A1B2HUZ9_9PSEU|nr:GDSL-type esterase/lipase family protein [Lentzea guizhouensis]ANZ41528.1 SGNH hydrolase [Lentzea guizhouensis]